jgi:hypothetical protein
VNYKKFGSYEALNLFYAMAGQIVKHAHKMVLKVYGASTGRSWFNEALMRREACFSAT